MQTIEALTAAAVALLQEASPAVIRRVLRELLEHEAVPAPTSVADQTNGSRSATARPPPAEAPAAPVKAAAPTKRKGKGTRKRPSTSSDSEWEQLRVQVRTAMTERGLSYATLAAAIDMAEVTTRLGICRTRAPGGSLVAKLRAWLAAPAVAAPATFPGRRSSNGAGA